MIAELVFGANVSRQDVDIEILYDTVKEMREVFTVHLKHRSGTAVVKVSIVFALHFSNNLFSTLHISLVTCYPTDAASFSSVKSSCTSCWYYEDVVDVLSCTVHISSTLWLLLCRRHRFVFFSLFGFLLSYFIVSKGTYKHILLYSRVRERERGERLVGYCAVVVNTLLVGVQTSSALCWLLCRRQHFVG